MVTIGSHFHREINNLKEVKRERERARKKERERSRERERESITLLSYYVKGRHLGFKRCFSYNATFHEQI